MGMLYHQYEWFVPPCVYWYTTIPAEIKQMHGKAYKETSSIFTCKADKYLPLATPPPVNATSIKRNADNPSWKIEPKVTPVSDMFFPLNLNTLLFVKANKNETYLFSTPFCLAFFRQNHLLHSQTSNQLLYYNRWIQVFLFSTFWSLSDQILGTKLKKYSPAALLCWLTSMAVQASRNEVTSSNLTPAYWSRLDRVGIIIELR